MSCPCGEEAERREDAVSGRIKNYKAQMVKALRGRWQMWADGLISCPICAALVHPSMRGVHEMWHEFETEDDPLPRVPARKARRRL